MNEFNEDLRFSVAASHDIFWDAVYRKAFPSLVSHKVCSDAASQKMGIDRIIVLSSGKTIQIDEKKRRIVYRDILLEYTSVDKTNAPGWIEKDLAIDYLAYAFMPSKQCYLYPWDMLKRAWERYGDEWKAKYKIIPARNPTYTTYSVAVPKPVLRAAVSKASIIDVALETEGYTFC